MKKDVASLTLTYKILVAEKSKMMQKVIYLFSSLLFQTIYKIRSI